MNRRSAIEIVSVCARMIGSLSAAIEGLMEELRRLNRLGLESGESAQLNRRARARLVRERMAKSYREHNPCC